MVLKTCSHSPGAENWTPVLYKSSKHTEPPLSFSNINFVLFFHFWFF